MQTSPLAQSCKQVKKISKTPRMIQQIIEDKITNSNTQESIHHFQMSTKKLTDNYLQKINHKNKINFKIKKNNEDYRKVEKNVNEKLRLASLNSYLDVRTENTNRDFESPASADSRARPGQQNFTQINFANGAQTNIQENTENLNKSG